MATLDVLIPGMVSDETERPLERTEVWVTGSAYFEDEVETGVARFLTGGRA
jgi:hypothetical protein